MMIEPHASFFLRCTTPQSRRVEITASDTALVERDRGPSNRAVQPSCASCNRAGGRLSMRNRAGGRFPPQKGRPPPRGVQELFRKCSSGDGDRASSTQNREKAAFAMPPTRMQIARDRPRSIPDCDTDTLSQVFLSRDHGHLYDRKPVGVFISLI